MDLLFSLQNAAFNRRSIFRLILSISHYIIRGNKILIISFRRPMFYKHRCMHVYATSESDVPLGAR